MKIKIIKDYYCENKDIYDKASVDIKPGLTVLIGCNGSGKTTLLHQIKNYCDKEKIPHIEFDNLLDGGSNARSSAGFYGDFDFLSESMISSEGENINMNIGRFATKMGGFVSRNPNSKQLVFMMDAIDSGLSIDYILELKEQLFKTVLDDCTSRGIETYIIVSANEYELARNSNCLDVSSCKYVDLKNYEDYRNLVLETRRKKNRRYGWDEFDLE